MAYPVLHVNSIGSTHPRKQKFIIALVQSLGLYYPPGSVIGSVKSTNVEASIPTNSDADFYHFPLPD